MTMLVSACLFGKPCRYDGSFSGKVAGSVEVTSKLFAGNGIKVVSEKEI